MSDLISRQAAIDAIDRYYKDKRYITRSRTILSAICLDMKSTMDSLPSAQPERKRGRWERHYSRPNVYADLFWHCSECGYRSSDNWADKFNFCPNCGADMRQTEGNSNV